MITGQQESPDANKQDTNKQDTNKRGVVHISREQTAKLLKISVTEVRRRQALGRLTVVARGPHNTSLYALSEVLAYKQSIESFKVGRGRTFPPDLMPRATPVAATSFTAEEANMVFAELDAGASPTQCVRKLVLHPDKIEALLLSYERLAGVLIIDKGTVQAINALALDGSFPITRASEVLELLTEMTKGKPCRGCNRRPSVICTNCAVPYVRRRLMREAVAKRPTKPPVPEADCLAESEDPDETEYPEGYQEGD